jgi:hypothetical protein
MSQETNEAETTPEGGRDGELAEHPEVPEVSFVGGLVEG